MCFRAMKMHKHQVNLHFFLDLSHQRQASCSGHRRSIERPKMHLINNISEINNNNDDNFDQIIMINEQHE
jgi:hypothetical protein